MKRDIKIGVIGGDMRQLAMAHQLAEKGFRVCCFGTPKKDGRYSGYERCTNLDGCVSNCDAVILGVPYSPDGKWLNCPPEDYAISVKALLSAMTSGQLLLGGRLDEGLYRSAKEHSLKVRDYLDCEELLILNAIPTAEGGVEIAMKELDTTLRDAKILITGFGRVARVLAHTLKGLGCEVTISCRKKSESAWCRVYGYGFLPLLELKKESGGFDLIFNTVPSMIFTKEVLEGTRALMIDLASIPGGVDRTAAEELGIKVIRALSLPGKVAPDSAGRIIAGSVYDILKQEGLL